MRRLARSAALAAFEIVAIAREAVMIPLRLWMRAAEVAGRVTLAAWRHLAPGLRSALAALVAVLGLAERTVTPRRGALAVAASAALLLGASQFADYRGVEIGAPEYTGVGLVAPAPEVNRRTPIDEHGIALLAIAAASLAVTGLAAAGRRPAALALVPLGLAAVAVSLLADVPAGLDEGRVSLAYAGAHATLLGPFWVELSTALVIAALGPLLASYLQVGSSRRARRRAPSRLAAGGARP